jgi:hypothetical protein
MYLKHVKHVKHVKYLMHLMHPVNRKSVEERELLDLKYKIISEDCEFGLGSRRNHER